MCVGDGAGRRAAGGGFVWRAYRCRKCTAGPRPPAGIPLQLQHTAAHAATRCNTLQCTATHCNALQRTATHCNALQRTATYTGPRTATHTATPALFQACNAHRNTLRHSATHCNTRTPSSMPLSLQRTMQHTVTPFNTMQLTTHLTQPHAFTSQLTSRYVLMFCVCWRVSTDLLAHCAARRCSHSLFWFWRECSDFHYTLATSCPRISSSLELRLFWSILPLLSDAALSARTSFCFLDIRIIHIYIYVHTYVSIYTYIHTYLYIHTYVHTSTSFCFLEIRIIGYHMVPAFPFLFYRAKSTYVFFFEILVCFDVLGAHDSMCVYVCICAYVYVFV